MSKHILRLLTFTCVLSFAVVGCKKDDDLPDVPPSDNPGEIITKMVLNFTDSANASNTVTAMFSDPDGEGGNGPEVFDDIVLAANTTYFVTITLANESNPSSIEDVTPEILEEDDEHLFCFTATDADVTVERTDTDGQFEVGLSSTWRTGASSSGIVFVVLKHQPDVKDGTCTPGDTDIEVAFPTMIN
ncbi:MAG: hypothetical protein AAF570_26620 [Bacteroidota bacterium]